MPFFFILIFLFFIYFSGFQCKVNVAGISWAGVLRSAIWDWQKCSGIPGISGILTSAGLCLSTPCPLCHVAMFLLTWDPFTPSHTRRSLNRLNQNMEEAAHERNTCCQAWCYGLCSHGRLKTDGALLKVGCFSLNVWIWSPHFMEEWSSLGNLFWIPSYYKHILALHVKARQSRS